MKINITSECPREGNFVGIREFDGKTFADNLRINNHEVEILDESVDGWVECPEFQLDKVEYFIQLK